MTPPVEKLIFVQEASEALLKQSKQKSENIEQMSAKHSAESKTARRPCFIGSALGRLALQHHRVNLLFSP